MTNKPTEHDGQPIGVHAYECRKCGKGIEAMRADPVCRATPQEPDDDAAKRVTLVDRIKQMKAERKRYFDVEGDGVDELLNDLWDFIDRLQAKAPEPPYSGVVDEADFTRGEE